MTAWRVHYNKERSEKAIVHFSSQGLNMTYKITIKRSDEDGDLTLSAPNKIVTAKCYWNLQKKIPSGTYMNCSATTMARKKNSEGRPREAIFLPQVSGFSAIFIHMGKSPYQKWSDGCIVIEESKMLEIYDTISPKNGHNVIVMIDD